MEQSDVDLWNLSRSMGYHRDLSRSKKWCNSLLGIYLAYWFGIVALNLAESLAFLDKQHVFALLAEIPAINKILIFITFHVALTVMEERFKSINSLIRMKIDESVKHENYPPICEPFVQDLQTFVSMHIKNTKLTEKINNMFSLCLLFCITTTFLKLIGSIHLILCRFVIHTSHENIEETLELCLYTVFHSLVLFLLAQESKGLNYEVRLSF